MQPLSSVPTPYMYRVIYCCESNKVIEVVNNIHKYILLQAIRYPLLTLLLQGQK